MHAGYRCENALPSAYLTIGNGLFVTLTFDLLTSQISRLGLSHWDVYAMHRGGCLELYYCNMMEWSWWDSGLICKTNWFPSLL